MEIIYKRLTENELDTFINMRITQLTEEYTSEGRNVPEGADLKKALEEFWACFRVCTPIRNTEGWV